ncbi:MAG: hypothetical protein ABSG46_18775 [Candidatus Binataceae bacterium]|jgi:Flp pilus assembly pilin Flp
MVRRILNRQALRAGAIADSCASTLRIARAQTVAEYALVLALVAVIVLAAYELMGPEVASAVSVVTTTLLNTSTR